MTAAHRGEQITEIIIAVLREYNIVEKLGVFVGDNVDSNDAAWREVLKDLHPERNPKASRSRCLGHIINLAAKAFLLGKNIEAFEATVDAVNDLTPRDSEIMKRAQDAWRKKGPVGKMYNIITYIRSSPQRREAFRKTVFDERGDDLTVILDNSTRWNSIYLSLHRALTLRKRIETFYFENRVDVSKDLLNDEEWSHVEEVVNGLEPFYEVTLRLEGQAKFGHHGAIWEALPAISTLLEAIESGKTRAELAHSSRHPLVVAYQNGWEKLRKYYELTDDAHSIYAAAILLYPSYRKSYFDYYWTGNEEAWKDLMIQNVKKTWKDEYQPRVITLTEQQQA